MRQLRWSQLAFVVYHNKTVHLEEYNGSIATDVTHNRWDVGTGNACCTSFITLQRVSAAVVTVDLLYMFCLVCSTYCGFLLMFV